MQHEHGSQTGRSKSALNLTHRRKYKDVERELIEIDGMLPKPHKVTKVVPQISDTCDEALYLISIDQ